MNATQKSLITLKQYKFLLQRIHDKFDRRSKKGKCLCPICARDWDYMIEAFSDAEVCRVYAEERAQKVEKSLKRLRKKVLATAERQEP